MNHPFGPVGGDRSEAIPLVPRRAKALPRSPGIRAAQTATACLIFAAFATASFDVTGNIRLGGANLRLFNLLQIAVIGAAALTLLQNDRLDGRVLKLFGAGSACLAMAAGVDLAAGQIAARPESKATGYSLWLLLNGTFALSGYLVGAYILKPARLMNLYLASFLVTCAIGVVQFVLGIGGINFFVKQWWIEGRLPRLNAFTYEPSYLATYLITGFVVATHLWRCVPAPMKPLPRLTSIATGFLILLSSSRMGILMVAAYLAWIGARDFISPRVPAIRKLMTASAVLSALTIGTIGLLAVGVPDGIKEMFLSGTGLAGTADHSVSMRQSQIEATFEVFLDHPLIGVGLGNVGISAFEILYGDAVSLLDPSGLTGMNITYETLAGMGVVGFCFLAAFVATLFRGARRSLAAAPAARRVFHGSMLAGFAALMLILQLNQNILRGYIWCHLFAVAAITGAMLVNTAKPRPARRRGRRRRLSRLSIGMRPFGIVSRHFGTEEKGPGLAPDRDTAG
ncbi:O-antigen ligase family protein [Chthonobacter albigriseus]|uniref:O-antigen ligase family protein n=1 Tax=Chthonobacter albigriseus TaxID=1683161 RepID=UPI0015EE9525|nr:O-antigen ligase family protein [Chthonobacter albigriseus]